jgi:hypothetical protein
MLASMFIAVDKQGAFPPSFANIPGRGRRRSEEPIDWQRLKRACSSTDSLPLTEKHSATQNGRFIGLRLILHIEAKTGFVVHWIAHLG